MLCFRAVAGSDFKQYCCKGWCQNLAAVSAIFDVCVSQTPSVAAVRPSLNLRPVSETTCGHGGLGWVPGRERASAGPRACGGDSPPTGPRRPHPAAPGGAQDGGEGEGAGGARAQGAAGAGTHGSCLFVFPTDFQLDFSSVFSS